MLRPDPAPGVSSMSTSPPSRSHASWRVTPGLAADLAARRPTSRLMSALLPMLGKPITAARTARGCRPRRARAAFSIRPASTASLLTCRREPANTRE